jgi:hypothetical protein
VTRRNISNEGFDLSLKGSLTNIGPLDALITFTEPVKYVLFFILIQIAHKPFSVNWQGRDIATITLPPSE